MIPYGRHHIEEDDIQAVVNVLRSGALTQGPAIAAFESALAEKVGAKYAVVVSSGTAALHIAALAASVKKGDVWATSTNTFAASANAGLYCGADVKFTDIDPQTLNMTAETLNQVVGALPSVKAIVPVHFGGVACEMEKIQAVAKKKGAVVIEDAAHALGGRYADGSMIGNGRYSDMTIFSFHPVKAIAAGEGGAVMTNDPALYKRLQLFRTHGIQKASTELINKDLAVTDGQVNPWYYEMQEIGFNYRLTDMQSALGQSQLRKLDKFMARRQQLAAKYNEAFKNIPHLVRPQAAFNSSSGHHIYVLQIDYRALGTTRTAFMKALQEKGVGSQVHYLPVHLHPVYQRLGYTPGQFQNAEHYYAQALTLPLFVDLSDQEQRQVIDAVLSLTKQPIRA